jgi:hypothetical protein
MFWAAAAIAQCVNTSSSVLSGSNINLLAGSGATSSMMNSAVAMWSGGCGSSYGSTFPRFTVGGGGGGPNYTVKVLGHNASGSGDCGSFSGTTVTLWSTTDRNGQVFNCGDLSMNLAHEIGHILGLPDASSASSCANFMMADLQGDGSNRNSRSVQGEECSDADQRWSTQQERDAASGGGTDCAST